MDYMIQQRSITLWSLSITKAGTYVQIQAAGGITRASLCRIRALILCSFEGNDPLFMADSDHVSYFCQERFCQRIGVVIFKGMSWVLSVFKNCVFGVRG